jgi:hypothetical protein
MNKVTKGLLIAALTFSANNVGAYTNKTFLQPRNQALVNLPLLKTTWCERIGAPLEDRFGGHFQVVGFYGQNTNKSDTGKYFGTLDKNSFSLNGADNLTGTATAFAASTVADIDGAYIIHQENTDNSTLKLSLALNPESISYGVNLAYHQDLSKIVNGLYLKVVLPVQRVENDPKLSITQTTPVANLTAANFLNYFKGTYTPNAVIGAANAQALLQKGKINGKQSATGIADLDIVLGYKFLNKETYHFGINLGLSIPTGKEATGEFLFEPLYGSKHFGLGGGLHAGARVWGDEDHNFKLAFAANYRYLFQASEKRYTGIKNRNFAQYYLLSQFGVAANAQALIPAANLLTQNVDVTPGSQLDGILGLAYNKGGFNLDLGYNVYFKESESVKLKNDWSEGKYYIAARNQLTSVGGNALGSANNGYRFDNNNAGAGAGVAGATNMLSKSLLDVSAASTDSQFTHSVYGGLGYAFKEWEYPLMLGLGGKYEFASKNSALEGWQAWAKAGLSF